MSYKVEFRGQGVTCDSPEEVAALLNLESGRPQLSGRPKTIQSVVESLAAQQKQVVHLLNDAWPEVLTDEKLREGLHLTGDKKRANKKLAGVLAGINKASKRANISPIINHESVRGSAGDRVHKYRLEEIVHAALSGKDELRQVWRQAIEDKKPGAPAHEVLDRLERKYRDFSGRS